MNLKICLSLILSVAVLSTAHAKDVVKDFKNFKQIPVMESGRFKPLDTYARSFLTQLSGKDHVGKTPAIEWIAKLFFNPESTINDKIFLINNPDVATALGITPDTHRKYTPEQLKKAYKKLASLQELAIKIPEKERSLVENEIIRVFDNVNQYADLSRSLLFTLAQPDFSINTNSLKDKLGLSRQADNFSFIDIAIKADVLTPLAQGLQQKTRSQYNQDEIQVLRLVTNLFQWTQQYKDSPLLVIPHDGQWISPWEAVSSHLGEELMRPLLTQWQHMAVSYHQGNDVEFNVASHLYLDEVSKGLNKDEQKNFKKFNMELFYHASSPFTWGIMFYIFTFIFFVISFSSSKPIWYQLGLYSTFAGFAIHTLGLIMRIIIMSRPPVSSLYETFIFVGFIAVLLGLFIEHYNRQWLGLITAAISGTALLFIANKYSAEGDTLKMLIAVLNSNFWLATHVTTITMGYGATCVGGLLGHIWLLQSAFGKDQQTLDKTYKTTLGILGVALTLTFLGTNLGGIWADQSWGRFWGWDPKENGALMIVLWIAMLFHAKVAQMIGPLGLAIGAVIGMIVVMWAWFGVNLLSVGLHSYGFTAGIATTLLAYVIFEILFIVITGFISRSKK